MKKMIMIALTAVGSLIIIAICIYAYYGGFSKINIKMKTAGGETIVYQEVQGDYNQTMTASNEIYDYLLNDLKIETNKGVGIFHDNPKEVPKEKLRSDIGCIIEPQDIERLNKCGCKYKVMILPIEKVMITEFPFKGKPSIFIGMLKIYPAIEKYTKAHNIPSNNPLVEIYDIPNSKTIYRK